MFELNEQQQMVQMVMRQFCTNEILPNVEALESGGMSPFDLIRKLFAQLGVGEMMRHSLEKRIARMRSGAAPAAASSADGDEEDAASIAQQDIMTNFVIVKELSRVAPGLCMSFGVSVGLAAMAILKKGSADQIERWAIPLMTCERVGSWCLTEPGAGSDAFGSMTTVAREAGGHLVVNGAKTFITNGPVADIFVVYSKYDDGSGLERKQMPVVTFVAEKGMPGFSTGKPMEKLGMKDSPTSELFFDDVRIPRSHVLGDPKQASGRAAAKESLGDERSGVPAMCWGIVERCYELALKYARERQQFGRPIGEFQAVQLKLADMFVHLKNVENIVYRTAWMGMTGKRDVAFVCASKVYCARAAVEAALDAIQIHGGYGYMKEYHVEKLLRDAKLLEIGAGTTDINALTTARLELAMGGG